MTIKSKICNTGIFNVRICNTYENQNIKVSGGSVKGTYIVARFYILLDVIQIDYK